MAKGKSKLKKDKIISTNQEIVIHPELMGSFASIDAPIRTLPQGQSGLQSISLKYPNLYNEGLPYQYGSNCTILISDAILLCQKAYCRIGSFKNAIDIMSEICANTPVYLDEGNAESISFFEAWLRKININKLKDQFFRELFRSGNIFLYRVDGEMTPESAKKIKQLYAKAQKIDMPLRYILLNPSNIAVYGGLNFESPVYYRLLNKFEVDVLKNSQNDDDKQLYKNLPAAMKAYFDGGAYTKPVVLDKKKLHTVFYKKQDYEPFAIPLGFAVLDSLELKLAMQKCDGVLARTVEYAILLITMGAEKDKGGTNPESLKLLKEAFRSEQVGRVLVADYTTKAQFVIPDLNKIFGEAKYKIVNQDIAEGLMNIFFEQESRQVNLTGKIKVFTEKLTAAQDIFVNEFLTPEIKRISKLMGFKAYPIPSMGRINLDDQSQMLRIYTQLLQMGVLTPKDGLEAIERGIFPDYEELHTNHEGLKKDKDVGLFQPITGSPYTQLQIAKLNAKTQSDNIDKQQEHQLEQTKLKNQHEIKKTKMQHDHEVKNPTPQAPNLQVVTKPIANPPNLQKSKQPTGRPPGSKGKISMAKLIDNIKLHSKLTNEVTNEYKSIKKIKKLTDTDQNNIQHLVYSICAFETPNNWINKVKEYIKTNFDLDQDKMLNIEELAQTYGISGETAAIVSHSINEEE
jgi:hypothetical protein